MKPFLTLALIMLLLSLACRNGNQSKQKKNQPSSGDIISKNSDANPTQVDSIQLINTCENESFISELRENTNLNTNGYILTIKSKDGVKKIVSRLDLPPGKAQINYCIDEYTVVGFSCGGPCYSQVFVFTEESKANEQFAFCQRIGNNPNLIAHIEKEEFEELIIHSFDTGKELKIDVSDSNFWNYGHMDTLFTIKNNLILRYTPENKPQKQKTINLEKIL
jgi:hypothetical protein